MVGRSVREIPTQGEQAAFKAGVRAGVALNAELGTHLTLQQMQSLVSEMQRMVDRFEELGTLLEGRLNEVEQGSVYWSTDP
jgi:hypothetical protein